MKTFKQLSEDNSGDFSSSFAKHFNKNHQNSHIGKNVLDVSTVLTKNQNKLPHPTALNSYVEDSAPINHHLINNAKKTFSSSEGLVDHKQPTIPAHHVRDMDNNMKQNNLKTDLHVFHAAGYNPGKEASKNPERKIHLPSYTSTSIDHNVADHFARPKKDVNKSTDTEDHFDQHIIHFHVPKGHTGVYTGGVEHPHDNWFGSQHEFILPRNTTAKIATKPTTFHEKTTDHTGKPMHIHTHVWDAHVLQDSAYKESSRKVRRGIGSYSSVSPGDID